MENWNSENIRLDTVLLPATNAPSAPIHGANTGHVPPATVAAPSARVSGMLAMSVPPNSAPLLMKTRTRGTANSRATAAPAIWPPAIFQEAAICRPLIRCSA